MTFKAILFDAIGTTILEKDPSLIASCFNQAFSDNNVALDPAIIRANRGRDKKVMIREVLNQQKLPESMTEPVYSSFKHHISRNLQNFTSNSGALELFKLLKEQGLNIGIGTGLDRDLFLQITHHLHWDLSQFDYIGIANEVGAGRPDPAMITDMMNKLSITNPKEFIKVGDTVADIREGRNAAVVTIAIASGTQPIEDLKKENPDRLIHNLMELKMFIK